MDDNKTRRANGTGTVLRRGRFWMIEYTVSPGNRKQESARTAVRAEAEALLRRRLEELGQGIDRPDLVQKLTVDEFLDDVLTDYRVNGRSTVKDVESRVRLHLSPFFGRMRAVKVRNPDAQRYIAARRAEGAPDSTIANELSVVRRALRLAVENGRLPTAPYIGLPAGHDRPRKGFVSPEGFRAIMPCLPEYLRPLVSLAFHTGMRLGELLALRWQQVDLADGIIRLSAEETKTRTARTVPVPSEPLLLLCMRKLQRDQQDPSCNAVFFRERTGKDGPGSLVPLGKDFRWVWKESCRKAGLPGLLFHDLRRSGVRMLVRSGVDEHTAMAISGHKTRSIFDRYNIVSEADLRTAVRKLDAHLSAPAPESEKQAEPLAPETVN